MEASPIQPIRFRSRIERDSSGGTLIRRVLGRTGIPDDPLSAVVELDHPEVMPIAAALVDASGGRARRTRTGATVFHCLWCRDEPNAAVLVGSANERDLIRHSISPGDTVYLPPGDSLAIGPGILGYEVWSTKPDAQPDSDAFRPLPTHGLERFEGYNRRTVCAAGPHVALERWKVTQPLSLPIPAGRGLFVTNLVEPMAIVWHGGADLIGRAESRLLPAGLGTCTFIPDGLGYLLVSYVPDVLADVVAPLREAGYGDARIATLGALGSALTRGAPAGAGDDRAPGVPMERGVDRSTRHVRRRRYRET